MKSEAVTKPVFVRKKCMACKMCVDACPVSCIGVEATGTPDDPHGYPFLEDAQACISCGRCAEGCPVAAVRLLAA
jgi:formate hydrogenlyase subunit 6/NADH:ubiquinone oxidoreductase subunit I